MKSLRRMIAVSVLLATVTFVGVALFLHASIVDAHLRTETEADLKDWASKLLESKASPRSEIRAGLERQCFCQLSVQTAGQWEPALSSSADVVFADVKGQDVVVRAQRRVSSSAVSGALIEVLVIAAVLALLMGIASTLVVSSHVLSPILELKDVATRLGDGDLAARMSVSTDPELLDVGRALGDMANDLSQRVNRLSAEQDRLRTILNSMVEGVFVTDAKGIIVSTNAALDGIVPNAKGRTVMEAIRNPQLHEAVSAARDGRGSSVELVAVVKNEQHFLDAEVAPLSEGGGVVAVMHDVTKLRLSDKIRRDFVANASHELRTPLTAIRGFTETLRNGALADTKTAERFLGIIHEHTLRLSRIVDDLVALSRAESTDHPVELTKVLLSDAVDQVVRGLSEKAHAAELTLEVGDLDVPPVRGDGDHLDQILINLVDNGIKYTPAGGRVRISASARDGGVVLDVFNTATILPKHLPRLFERFYRVDKGRAREVGGTGLGLAIVRHLVLAMQGEIEVDSDDVGTTFSVFLLVSED